MVKLFGKRKGKEKKGERDQPDVSIPQESYGNVPRPPVQAPTAAVQYAQPPQQQQYPPQQQYQQQQYQQQPQYQQQQQPVRSQPQYQQQQQPVRVQQQQQYQAPVSQAPAVPSSQPKTVRSTTTVKKIPPPATAPAAAPQASMPSSSARKPGPSKYQSVSHLPTTDANATREVVKKFIADIWNRGDLDLIPEVCHRSLRFNGSVGMDRVGHEGFARMVQTIRDALSDYHCEIHSMVVEGNKAFVRMRFTGRHTGALLGFEPTGRQVAWMGASEFTIKDGKILKVWELGDVKSLEQQLYPEDEM